MRRYPGKAYNSSVQLIIPCAYFSPLVMEIRRIPLIDRAPLVPARRRPPRPPDCLTLKVKSQLKILSGLFHGNTQRGDPGMGHLGNQGLDMHENPFRLPPHPFSVVHHNGVITARLA